MLSNMNHENVKIQYDRLRRHYTANLNGYDQIALLDLAHALRFFTEIPGLIDDKYGPKLLNANFNAGMKRIMRGAEFSYCYLPEDGVTVKAKIGWNGMFEFHGPSNDQFSIGGTTKLEANQRISIKEFFLIYRELSPVEIQLLNSYSQAVTYTKVGLKDYLNAIAVRFQFANESPKFISRIELIKRVANEYDASHASHADKPDDFVNHFSAPVQRLMQYSCADLPLPFFVLMHISKNILTSLEEKM